MNDPKLDNLSEKQKKTHEIIEKDLKKLRNDLKNKLNLDEKTIEEIKNDKKKLKKYKYELRKKEYEEIRTLKDITEKKDLKLWFRWFWFFLWESNSVWSWALNIVLAFVLIYFIIYPGLGLFFQTTHPVVAVVSGSMEHDGSFENWWSGHTSVYSYYNISKEQFKEFSFSDGFNKGDIIVLKGKEIKDINIGDVIVYYGMLPDPIIHRVINKVEYPFYLETKGDHNKNKDLIEITEKSLVGYPKYNKASRAVLRIPYLGWIKIAFASHPVFFMLGIAIFIICTSYFDEIKKKIKGN